MSTAAQEAARAIRPGPYEFDHPDMIKARRMWAEAIRRGKLAEGDLQLVTYFQVDTIRDRLLADVIDPSAWDPEDFEKLFLGGVRPDPADLPRLRAATELCISLVESTAAEGSDIAPMIMVMSFIQWLLGAGDLAHHGAHLALQARPGYTIAEQMLLMTHLGIIPRWMNNA